MNITDIDRMLLEKGNLCVSIIVPTHRYSKERIQDPKTVYKAVEKAKLLLHKSTWPKETIQNLETRLDNVCKETDYLRLQEGMAVFVSPNISKQFLLPFRVKEKVVVGKNFEIRDLFYYAQFLMTYYLLAVGKKRIALFKCEGRDLQEIRNDDFPRQYTEEYEYASPSIASSSSAGLKSYERDKSILEETRQIAFIKAADEAITKYLKTDTPLLVAGVEEELANFEHITRHVRNVVGKITGNYDYDAVHVLSEKAWKKMTEYVNASQQKILLKLREDIGRKLAVDGIRDVWKAGNDGKGLTLIVEKDYQPTGYRDPAEDFKLYLSRPSGKYEIIPDVADDVIEIVRQKGGNVVIVENGALEEYGHIAMLLRYE